MVSQETELFRLGGTVCLLVCLFSLFVCRYRFENATESDRHQ